MRSVKEWIADHDDQKIPQRVKARVADGANNRCQVCGVGITRGGEIDHTIALINGGEHRESNLRLLCKNCHSAKSRTDVSQKSKIAQIKKRMGPLRREQSPWSKRLEAYEYDWKLKRYVPKITERGND